VSVKTSIFIKGCREQLDWLSYNLQLLDRNWLSADTEIVIMFDEDCREIVQTWGKFRHQMIYCWCRPWPNPYLYALWCKANADLFTRGEVIMLLDCDIMLREPARLEEYFSDGKIILPFLHWKDRGDDGTAQRLWSRVVKESTGLDLERDWMVTRPWIYWRSTYSGARKLVEYHKNLPFYAATYSRQHYDWTRYLDHGFTFCDLENLGLYASRFEPDLYDPQDLIELNQQGRQDKFWDCWSHTPFEQVKPRLDALLCA